MKLDISMTIRDLMTHYPSAINVFIMRKMNCFGCPTEAFHTIEDVARINGMVLDQLTKDLQEAVGVTQTHDEGPAGARTTGVC